MNFGNFLAKLAHDHLSLNRVNLYQAGFKLASFYLIGEGQTAKTSLVHLSSAALPHAVTSDGNLATIEDSNKTLAVLIDSVTESRSSIVHDPVKWERKDDRIAHREFEDNLFENKVNITKAKANRSAKLVPLSGVAYIFPGDYKTSIPDLSETMLTKSTWFQQEKMELNAKEIIDMRKIFNDVTTKNGRFSCVFQDLIKQFNLTDFREKVDHYYAELLNTHEMSGVNLSRFLENYAILMASLAHLFETIGLQQEYADELMSDLQDCIDQKSIPFTLRELNNINPSRTPKAKKCGDPLEVLYRSLEEQDFLNVLLWLSFGNGNGIVYIATDILKDYSEKEIVKSIGYIEGPMKRVEFRSAKSGESVWFRRSMVPELSYGIIARRHAYKKELKSFPEKFSSLLLAKMNNYVQPSEEFTLNTNLLEQMEKIYGEKHAKKMAENANEDESGKKARQLFKNLTPRRQKRALDFMSGIADETGDSGTPSVSGTLVPKRLNFDSASAEGQATTGNETESK